MKSNRNENMVRHFSLPLKMLFLDLVAINYPVWFKSFTAVTLLSKRVELLCNHRFLTLFDASLIFTLFWLSVN